MFRENTLPTYSFETRGAYYIMPMRKTNRGRGVPRRVAVAGSRCCRRRHHAVFFGVVAVGSALVTGAMAASSTSECASLVPIEDRRRGKGAFFSGCTSRSITDKGGCWSSLIEEQSGCQTCIVQDTADTSQWSSSLFSEFFDFELDPCPDGVGDIYGGEPEGGIVTLDELTSAACGDDWLEYEGSCYFKSSFVESSTSWEDADARCVAMDARLVSLETEEENDFVIHSLLWIGFLGEAYTGLQKLSPDGEWSWKDTLDGFSPGEFSAAASFQDWAEGSDASSSYSDEGASCLEIMPYTPKVWNAFSCEVNKQFVCEKSAQSDEPVAADTTTPTTTPPPTLQKTVPPVAAPTPSPTLQETVPPLVAPTTAPVLPPTPSPSTITPATPAPTVAPTADPTTPPPPTAPPVGFAKPRPTTPQPTPSPSSSSSSSSALSRGLPSGEALTGSPTWSPTGSPTGSPTSAPTQGIWEASCIERVSDADGRYLALFDMSVYEDASCTAIPTGGGAGCNPFEIGQECRSCWWSCQGARSFIGNYSWMPQDWINFCPTSGLTDFEADCEAEEEKEDAKGAGTARRSLVETLRSALGMGGGGGSKEVEGGKQPRSLLRQ